MEFLETAEAAARIGGKVLQEWAAKFTTREKSPANLVTEADEASQAAIHEYIRARFPEHRFLGEEGLDHGGDCEYRWIIDPLDGTSNYVHRFPYYAVSIGLERGETIVAGAVYDPNRDEMFSATAGGGATLNHRPIRVSEIEQLPQALCMASLPPQVTREHPSVRKFLDVLEAAQSVQRTGSAALNLCSVACGRIEAFWSNSLHAWDTAAGTLIVREAGGKVTTGQGEAYSVHQPDILASNGRRLHAQLTEIFRGSADHPGA